MTITRKLTVHAMAVALAGFVAVPLSVAGGTGVATAAHVTPTYCQVPNYLPPYPPGPCFLRFNKASYKRHQILHFRSGNNFQPGERVDLTLTCAGGYTRTRDIKGKHANKAVDSDGVLTGQFRIDSDTPHGTCTLTAVGESSHSKVDGSFIVVPKHHKEEHHHKHHHHNH